MSPIFVLLVAVMCGVTTYVVSALFGMRHRLPGAVVSFVSFVIVCVLGVLNYSDGWGW